MVPNSFYEDRNTFLSPDILSFSQQEVIVTTNFQY